MNIPDIPDYGLDPVQNLRLWLCFRIEESYEQYWADTPFTPGERRRLAAMRAAAEEHDWQRMVKDIDWLL
jgi:hypothetical protein